MGSFRGTNEQAHHLHESPKAITIPLIILALLAIVGGWVGIPEVFIKGGHHLEEFLQPIFAQSNAITQKYETSHSTEFMLMGISVAVALVALIFAIGKFKNYKKKTK